MKKVTFFSFSEQAEEEDDDEDLKIGEWDESQEDDDDIQDYDVEKEEDWRSIEDPLDAEKQYFRKEPYTEFYEEMEIQRKIEEGENVKFEKLKLLQEDGTEIDMDDDDEDAEELENITAMNYMTYKTSEEEYEENKEWGLEDDDYEESEGDKMYFFSMDTQELVAA